MAITPHEAIASPAAILPSDDVFKLALEEKKIDDAISAIFQRQPIACRIEQLSGLVMGELVRRYEVAGWKVSPQPQDGRVGKATEVLAKGGAVDWLFVLQPDWTSAQAREKQQRYTMRCGTDGIVKYDPQ